MLPLMLQAMQPLGCLCSFPGPRPWHGPTWRIHRVSLAASDGQTCGSGSMALASARERHKEFLCWVGTRRFVSSRSIRRGREWSHHGPGLKPALTIEYVRSNLLADEPHHEPCRVRCTFLACRPLHTRAPSTFCRRSVPKHGTLTCPGNPEHFCCSHPQRQRRTLEPLPPNGMSRTRRSHPVSNRSTNPRRLPT